MAMITVKRKWRMHQNGLKINMAKTDICIFHRRNLLTREIELSGTKIMARNTIKILGITSDSRLRWTEHVTNAIKDANNIYCENEFVETNFQLLDNARSSKIAFVKRQQYEVGKNILLNRQHDINNMVEKQWLNLSLGCFKIKCKALFLNA